MEPRGGEGRRNLADSQVIFENLTGAGVPARAGDGVCAVPFSCAAKPLRNWWWRVGGAGSHLPTSPRLRRGAPRRPAFYRGVKSPRGPMLTVRSEIGPCLHPITA